MPIGIQNWYTEKIQILNRYSVLSSKFIGILSVPSCFSVVGFSGTSTSRSRSFFWWRRSSVQKSRTVVRKPPWSSSPVRVLPVFSISALNISEHLGLDVSCSLPFAFIGAYSNFLTSLGPFDLTHIAFHREKHHCHSSIIHLLKKWTEPFYFSFTSFTFLTAWQIAQIPPAMAEIAAADAATSQKPHSAQTRNYQHLALKAQQVVQSIGSGAAPDDTVGVLCGVSVSQMAGGPSGGLLRETSS